MKANLVVWRVIMSVASLVVSGCGVNAGPSPDPVPANANGVVHTSSGATVDTTPIVTEHGTVLARITTADGHTYSFGHASLSGALVVDEMGKVGSPPTLPALLRSTPSIVDLYRVLSESAPVPSGLLSPEKGTMQAASTAPPAAPSPPSDIHPLTLTYDQTWFQNNVCVGNNPSGHNIAVIYCDLSNVEINPTLSQSVLVVGGYYTAALIDQSAPAGGSTAAFVWTSNGWQVDYTKNIPSGDWYYAYWGTYFTYNASQVYGIDYTGPAALAMGNCCN